MKAMGTAMGRIARTAPSTANLPQAKKVSLTSRLKDGVKQVAGKNIRPKTYCEGEKPCRGADQLHREEQESERRISGGFGRTGKSQQIVADPVVPYSPPIEINESERGARQRGDYDRRGRGKSAEK